MILPVAIIGPGGFGREVLDVIEACNQDKRSYEPLGFIEDPEHSAPGTLINGLPILGGFDWLEKNRKNVSVICGVGAPEVRKKIIRRVNHLGGKFFSVIHPNAILTRWTTVGEGVVITAGCILTNQIVIGDHVHINLDCTIGHDVTMKAFTTLAPGVHVSGNITFQEGCYVGTGANLIQGLEIGAWSVIGAGSTITKDVPGNTVVVGVPGKVIKTKEPGWNLA
jgi:sugar O-acyltransferase (sialic acid O-acetyltransferase NeuD family)